VTFGCGSDNAGVNRDELLRLFDRRMRREVVAADPAVRVERDEQTVLSVSDGWSALLWSRLDESTADGEISRVLARLRELPVEAEWKLYGHDLPADLGRRLVRAGLEPGDEEAVLVAEIDVLPLETGVDVRVADTPELVAAFVDVNAKAFERSFEPAGRELLRALEQECPSRLGVIAYGDGMPASAGRIEFDPNPDFASIWGGGTLPELRGRGLYRATVAKRAQLARSRGYRFLQVDALPTSRPILERLGFVQITTTTPYTLIDGYPSR